jgi:hypothetical protein
VRRIAPWLAAAALVLAYPAYVLATEGGPSFPSRDECVEPATTDGDIIAVFGYFDSEQEAVVARDRALEVGFIGTETAPDGCGRVRVAVGGITTLEVGREFAAQARDVGLDVTLERADQP